MTLTEVKLSNATIFKVRNAHKYAAKYFQGYNNFLRKNHHIPDASKDLSIVFIRKAYPKNHFTPDGNITKEGFERSSKAILSLPEFAKRKPEGLTLYDYARGLIKLIDNAISCTIPQ